MAANAALLMLDVASEVKMPEAATAKVGGLAIAVAADADASATARLAIVHRFLRLPAGAVPVLDSSGEAAAQGGPVLDPEGRLIGMSAVGPGQEPIVIPATSLVRVLGEPPSSVVEAPARSMAGSSPPSSVRRRGWLGVALQPITVPDQLIARAGQTSGRMVVSITTGGPADRAGLCVGDVLLALNGTSTTGPNSLRAFLAEEKIGSTVEVRVLREGNVYTTQLVIGSQ